MFKSALSMFLVVLLVLSTFMVFTGSDTVLAAAGTAVINFNTVISNNDLGVGVQWDPEDLNLPDFTSTQWNTLYSRVDFMAPKFARVMFNTGYYVTGLDGNGNPQYNWNSTGMNRLCKILDYCQSRGVTVMFGEWFMPSWATSFNDSRWIKAICDCLNYLKNTKLYTCIKYYNFVNEPNGDWMYGSNPPDLNTRWNMWYNGVIALKNEFNNRGFSWLQICGPDTAYQDDWVDKSVDSLSSQVTQYELHKYEDYDSYVTSGEIESTISTKRSYINYKGFGSRLLWLGELGMKQGRDPNYDCQPRVKNFDYGVLMADAVSQNMRAGGVGTIPWDLDDAMHMADYNTGTLKQWGFWNTLGGSTINGKYYPTTDTNIRPWFYTMSLFSKLFPAGWQIISITSPGINGVRTVAAKHQNGSNWDLSVAVINDSTSATSVLVTLPGMTNTATFKQYNYISGDMPVDGNGFATPEMNRVNNLTSGVQLDFSGQGVIFLTTTQGGTPVTVGTVPPPSGPPIGQTIWLKANANSLYTSAWLGGSNPLQARASTISTWEKYKVLDGGNGYIGLQAIANNQYVSAWVSDPNTPLEARSPYISDWERFTWVNNGDGTISLKAKANNLYVSAWVSDPNTPLEARSSSISTWEKFQWAQTN